MTQKVLAEPTKEYPTLHHVLVHAIQAGVLRCLYEDVDNNQLTMITRKTKETDPDAIAALIIEKIDLPTEGELGQ